MVVGDRSSVGESAGLRDSIVLPGTQVQPGSIMIGAIAGHGEIVQGLRPLDG
jgi:hypothetical protein